MGAQLSGHGIGTPGRAGMTGMAGTHSPMDGGAAMAGYGPSDASVGGGFLGSSQAWGVGRCRR